MVVSSVTLDLDGTLLDTIADLADACDEMLRDLGREPLGVERVRRFVGKGMAVLVERCLTAADGHVPDAAWLASGISSFRHHYAAFNGRSARIYPGVREGLEAFRALGLPLGVVTNKPAAFTGPLLERTGLADFFVVSVSGDTTANKKPHPEPVLHACRVLGVPPEKNLHIGDSDNDLLAARAAGSLAWAVPYGYTEESAGVSVGTEGIVATLLEAARRVAELNGRTLSALQ